MQTNAQTAATNWANGMANAGPTITAGVNALTVSPTQSAIAAIPQQVAGVQAAAASGKTAAALGAVTLQQWQQAMITKGVPRVGTGAAAAKTKFAAFMGKFLPFVQQQVQNLNATQPRGTLAQNIQRSVTMQQNLATFSNVSS